MNLHLVSLSQPGNPDLLRTRIGDVLRQERRAQGKTLQELSEEANLSPSHLSDIERGRKEASSEVIRGIHRSLGLELDDLLHRAAGTSGPQLSMVA